jgi:hypothetical protein
MPTIRREDKMIASSLHPDIAPRAPAPIGTESRPRKPLALLLSGLILIGVAAPPMADTAYGTPVKKLTSIKDPYEKCLVRAVNGLYVTYKSQDFRDRYAKLVCDKKHKGVAITKEDQAWIDYNLPH